MPVLVVYASRHGSAQGIAERIGATGIASELRRTRPPTAP
jgi:flavodoxin